MSEETFSRVEPSEERMYGPRGVVVCGYPPGEHAPLIELLERICGKDLTVRFAGEEAAGETLSDLLTHPHRRGEGPESGLSRALVLSGLTQKELHTLMAAYRQSGLPAQLWAVLTPTTEGWPLRQLLAELAREADAMRKRRTPPSGGSRQPG
jgi:hypothetical protein